MPQDRHERICISFMYIGLAGGFYATIIANILQIGDVVLQKGLSSVIQTPLKFFIAFLAATALANGLCYFYFSPPIQIPNPEGFTAIKLAPSNHNTNRVEGYCNMTIDENGFNNNVNFPYRDARAIFLGSSQMEGENVNPTENYVARLNAAMPNLQGYNLGVSSTTFVTNFVRIPALVEKFPKSEIVVFEINGMPRMNELIKMRDELAGGQIPEGYNISWKTNNPIMHLASNLPIFRLIWYKYKTLDPKNTAITKGSVANESSSFDASTYETILREVLTLGKSRAGSRNILIFSIDRLQQHPDGSVEIEYGNGEAAIFAKVTAELGIDYVSTGEAFLADYNNRHNFPCGFYNTKPNVGHLNKYGHETIANELAPVVGGLLP